MLIGATMNETDLPTFKDMLAGNDWMRIFPRDVKVASGRTVKVLPAWNDGRFKYCHQVGAIPFVSTKVDGDPAGLAHVREQLLAMPAGIRLLYITDRHEPEGDLPADQFKSNFNAFLAMVDSLPPELRSRIRCGPVLTRTWTERDGVGGLKPGRSYDLYDPGTGDFFAVDMYVQSGTSKAVVTPQTLPTAQQFTGAFKAYRKDDQDRRDRLWAEFGVIGMPADPDGTARAAWMRAVHNEAASWDPTETGWNMIGWMWWNSLGKATGEVAQIGQRRDFPLHLRTVPAASVRTESGGGVTVGVAAEQLPGDPPAPVAAYNEIWAAQRAGNTPRPQAPADPKDPAGTYADGWRDGRAHLAAEISAVLAAGHALTPTNPTGDPS